MEKQFQNVWSYLYNWKQPLYPDKIDIKTHTLKLFGLFSADSAVEKLGGKQKTKHDTKSAFQTIAD